MGGAPFQIAPRFVERVWGSTDLSPWFGHVEARTGEVWFDAGPILIKFLFTSEPLSVQVHPDDRYAREKENSSGKTELWYVLRAGPGARIALGFRNPVSREEVRRAAERGDIEAMLGWHEPKAGDTFFTPAGTVHALGASLAVCEIQQNSDITYRLYDYQRGRPLHLDKGLEVADLGAHPGLSKPEELDGGGTLLARCDYFVTERWQWKQPAICGGGWIIILSGRGSVEGEVFEPGQVWKIASGSTVRPEKEVTLLRTYVPAT